MKLVSLFIFEPCSGWQLGDIHEYKNSYSCTDAFTEKLCEKENMHLSKKEVDCIGNAMVVHLDMKYDYSVKHPDSNQAHYKAEAVLVM
jgi:hypothetical protein